MGAGGQTGGLGGAERKLSGNPAAAPVWAVLLAAGAGNRFGSQKQFAELLGKPLWRRVYDTLATVVPPEKICIVGLDNNAEIRQNILGFSALAGLIPGGERRTESVLNGLSCIRKKIDENGGPAARERVLILESARPLVTPEQIQRLIDCGASSAAFVTPLVNTIIRRDGLPTERADYYDLLTPFIFDFDLIYSAYSTGKYFDVTDDTRAVWECHGIKPLLLETGRNLFKVTYPEDIAIAEALAIQWSVVSG
jgi:2-C-methyl-D-erythritol 4-phosphate cytidylyltransferase